MSDYLARAAARAAPDAAPAVRPCLRRGYGNPPTAADPAELEMEMAAPPVGTVAPRRVEPSAPERIPPPREVACAAPLVSDGPEPVVPPMLREVHHRSTGMEPAAIPPSRHDTAPLLAAGPLPAAERVTGSVISTLSPAREDSTREPDRENRAPEPARGDGAPEPARRPAAEARPAAAPLLEFSPVLPPPAASAPQETGAVHITIGRLEIRAATPPPERPRAKPAAGRGPLALDDFLRAKSARPHLRLSDP